MENKTKLNAAITRYNVTIDYVHSYIENNIVKVIFLDEEYSDISTDKEVHEIHKFKSKYRANTYVIVPLKIVKSEDDKYVQKIDFDYDNETPHGFAVVSKHDLRDLSKEMKKAKKEKRVAYGKQLCVDYINKLNYVLVNRVFHVTIKDNQGNLLYEDNIPGEFKDVNMFVLNKMNNM